MKLFTVNYLSTKLREFMITFKKRKENLFGNNKPFILNMYHYPNIRKLLAKTNAQRILSEVHVHFNSIEPSPFFDKKKKRFIFYISTGHLAKLSDSRQPTVSRNLNILATIGLVTKHFIKPDSKKEQSKIKYRELKKYSNSLEKYKANKLMFPESNLKYYMPYDNIYGKPQFATNKTLKEVNAAIKSNYNHKVNDITYLSVPYYSDKIMKRADEVAEIILKSKISLNSFTKIALLRHDVFSETFIQSIFYDNRGIGRASDYVSRELENTLLKQLEMKNYTTKNDVIKRTILKNESLIDYVYSNESYKTIKTRELNRCIDLFLKKHDLAMLFPKKTLCIFLGMGEMRKAKIIMKKSKIREYGKLYCEDVSKYVDELDDLMDGFTLL